MRGKIARAAPLYIVGIGDSIQCIANVTTQSGATPNGAVRDIATGASGYLQGPGIVGAPIYSALPVFTAAQLGRTADANGAIYSKLSFMWELVAAIQARTGLGLGAGGIRYDNFSIAGQGAAALYSGGPTAWLNAAIALAPDVIIVNMGINDYGTAQATLLASMGGIITTIRAAGIEVIVMGVANNTAGSAGWDVVTRTLREASEANGAAHVSLLPLYDPRFIGALGVGPLDRCGANRINHPGPREHVQIGAMLSRMVLGG
jgi:lysophospholipase L1-like esterase